MSLAYINYLDKRVKGNRPPSAGDIRYFGAIDQHRLMFLVHVLDVRRSDERVSCEIRPVAGDNTCIWVDAAALYELVDPVTVNRSERAAPCNGA